MKFIAGLLILSSIFILKIKDGFSPNQFEYNSACFPNILQVDNGKDFRLIF